MWCQERIALRLYVSKIEMSGGDGETLVPRRAAYCRVFRKGRLDRTVLQERNMHLGVAPISSPLREFPTFSYPIPEGPCTRR